MNLFGLEFLAFGNITVAVLTLVVVALVLAGVVQVGIMVLKLSLADDVTGFGKGFKNKVWIKLQEISQGKEVLMMNPNIVKHTSGGYLVKEDDHGWFYTTTGGDFYKSPDMVDKYCVFTTLEDAYKLVIAKHKKVYKGGIYSPALWCIPLVDIVILSASYYFLPTVIICGVVSLVYTTRTISKLVYKNTTKLKNHSGRIEDLENKVGE